MPKYHAGNPDSHRFSGEFKTRTITAEDISVSRRMTIEKPPKEFTRGSTFTGKLEIIHTPNLSFLTERLSPFNNQTFFVIGRNSQ